MRVIAYVVWFMIWLVAGLFVAIILPILYIAAFISVTFDWSVETVEKKSKRGWLSYWREKIKKEKLPKFWQ